MDIRILLLLQDFRNGVGACLVSFFSKMSDIGDMSFVLTVMAVIYWCVSKAFGQYLLMGWSGNRVVNGLLKVTACVYRPWIRDVRIIPDGEALAKATGYSFPSGHSMNPRFALYGGINARAMLYLVMILSGVMAGLGGAFEALGSKGRYVDQMIFSTGYAWTGMVAALLANMNPVGTLLASVLLAGLAVGGSTMMLNMDIPLEVCNIIEGIITLFMSARMIRIAAGNMKRRKQAKGGGEA